MEKVEGGNPDPEDAAGTLQKKERRSLDPDDAAALIARVERCRDLEDVKSLLKISFSQLQVTFFCFFFLMPKSKEVFENFLLLLINSGYSGSSELFTYTVYIRDTDSPNRF